MKMVSWNVQGLGEASKNVLVRKGLGSSRLVGWHYRKQSYR